MSEDYPFCATAIVPVGADRWVTLCHRLALVPGVGQIWHTTVDSYVLSTVDIHGIIRWSVILEPQEFIRSLNAQGRLVVTLTGD